MTFSMAAIYSGFYRKAVELILSYKVSYVLMFATAQKKMNPIIIKR